MPADVCVNKVNKAEPEGDLEGFRLIIYTYKLFIFRRGTRMTAFPPFSSTPLCFRSHPHAAEFRICAGSCSGERINFSLYGSGFSCLLARHRDIIASTATHARFMFLLDIIASPAADAIVSCLCWSSLIFLPSTPRQSMTMSRKFGRYVVACTDWVASG